MLHSAIHKYRHALGQLVPLLGCTVIGHSQGELAKGTEKNKLSVQPCCINEGDGKTWQPNHVNHGLLEGLQSLNWLISRRGANPIWQDMAPTPRSESASPPHALPRARVRACVRGRMCCGEKRNMFCFFVFCHVHENVKVCLRVWQQCSVALRSRGDDPCRVISVKVKIVKRAPEGRLVRVDSLNTDQVRSAL